MSEVVLEQVTKIYPGNVRAVDRISLEVADREFVVLVGPSGCGKSTTLRMIAGLEEVTEGTIQIEGRVVNDVPPKDRDIAMVFQNYALYPHMTVYKNLSFGLRLRKVPRPEIDRKVREAADLLGISELLARKPKALSGGQRQRVALGRAIVRNPRAFLFDEPLSNLDAKLRVEMRAELKKLHRRLLTTTIYVTHDQEEAMTLGDRVVVMKDGLIQQCGSPLGIYDRPKNRFVAGFVGMPPMNFLEGRIERNDGRLCFNGGSCRIGVPDRMTDGLSRYVGQRLILGVRPESLSDRRIGGSAGEDSSIKDSSIEGSSIEVTVSVVEPLGDRMDVYIQTPGHDPLVCRLDSHSEVREGMALTMYLDMSRVHFFEPGETGVNVSLNGHGAAASGN